jgi:hypothetical protein
VTRVDVVHLWWIMITTFASLTIPQHYMCIYLLFVPYHFWQLQTLIILFSKTFKNLKKKQFFKLTNIFEEKYGTWKNILIVKNEKSTP